MTQNADQMHNFVNKREYGIYPHPDHVCAVCGIKRGDHVVPPVPCKAALNIAGEHFQCDLNDPHGGWAHSNRDAQAIWQGSAPSEIVPQVSR